MNGHETLEGIARDLLDATCTEPPVCAFSLAAACGFAVRPGQVQGALIDGDGGCIYLSPHVTRPERQHSLLGHELGHWLLWRNGLDDTEAAATYLAGALLVPRVALDRTLRRDGWSIEALRRVHPNASHATLAVRITQVRPAVQTVFDGDVVRVRRASPWLDRDVAPVRPWERDLAARALELGGEAVVDGPAVAVPIAKTVAVVVARRWWA